MLSHTKKKKKKAGGGGGGGSATTRACLAAPYGGQAVERYWLFWLPCPTLPPSAGRGAGAPAQEHSQGGTSFCASSPRCQKLVSFLPVSQFQIWSSLGAPQLQGSRKNSLLPRPTFVNFCVLFIGRSLAHSRLSKHVKTWMHSCEVPYHPRTTIKYFRGNHITTRKNEITASAAIWPHPKRGWNASLHIWWHKLWKSSQEGACHRAWKEIRGIAQSPPIFISAHLICTSPLSTWYNMFI